MRVNSAFTGFLDSRLIVRWRVAVLLIACVFMASSFERLPDRDLQAKQVNILIRQIGHKLLWQAGDSTSRVLPVIESKNGTFVLKFENEFVFSHDSLMILSQVLLPKAQFPSGYTVTVHDCKKDRIIYGFQLNNSSPDILACSGRNEPAGCYTIEYVFPDLYKNVAHTNANIDLRSEKPKSVKADLEKIDPKPKESEAAIIEDEIDPRINDNKSVKTDAQAINTSFKYPLVIAVNIGMLVLLGVALYIWRFKKMTEPVQHQNNTASKESVVALPAIGKFLFNVKDQLLILGNEVISLTDKECKILDLLYQDFGELIPREMLMQKVWIDEGVITGRSLDMFVSKLRKKLSGDPDLRITNIHGKGYKLEFFVHV